MSEPMDQVVHRLLLLPDGTGYCIELEQAEFIPWDGKFFRPGAWHGGARISCMIASSEFPRNFPTTKFNLEDENNEVHDNLDLAARIG
jgi:hypothetical protein